MYSKWMTIGSLELHSDIHPEDERFGMFFKEKMDCPVRLLPNARNQL
jgi:hypothetical protein